MGENGHSLDKYKVRILARTPDAEVWLVHGKKVRKDHVEFVEGGHDLVYDWVPKGRVLIDDALHEDEYVPVMIHELYERELMKKGVPYSKAHTRANRVESRVRRSKNGDAKKTLARQMKPYFCNKCLEWHNFRDRTYTRHTRYNHND